MRGNETQHGQQIFVIAVVTAVVTAVVIADIEKKTAARAGVPLPRLRARREICRRPSRPSTLTLKLLVDSWFP